MPHQEKSPGDEDGEARRQQSALAMRRVDHGARWGLHGDADQTAEGERVTDATWIPCVRREIGGEERAKAGLNIGEEKIEPFNGPQAALSSWYRVAHGFVSLVLSRLRPFRILSLTLTRSAWDRWSAYADRSRQWRIWQTYEIWTRAQRSSCLRADVGTD